MTQLEMLRTTDATRHYPIFGVPTCTHNRLRAIQAHLGPLTTCASDISFMWPSLNKWFTVPVDAAKKLYLPMTALLLRPSCYAEYVGYLSLFLSAELSRLSIPKNQGAAAVFQIGHHLKTWCHQGQVSPGNHGFSHLYDNRFPTNSGKSQSLGVLVIWQAFKR
jgi:hypothetical protein